MPDPGDQTDFGYFGLQPEEQSVKAAARAAALRDIGASGMAAMLSGYGPAADIGKMITENSQKQQGELGGTAKSVLTATLKKQQDEITNKREQAAADARNLDEAEQRKIGWFNAHTNRMRENNSTEMWSPSEDKVTGETILINKKTGEVKPLQGDAVRKATPEEIKNHALKTRLDPEQQKEYESAALTSGEAEPAAKAALANPGAFGLLQGLPDTISKVPIVGPAFGSMATQAASSILSDKELEARAAAFRVGTQMLRDVTGRLPSAEGQRITMAFQLLPGDSAQKIASKLRGAKKDADEVLARLSAGIPALQGTQPQALPLSNPQKPRGAPLSTYLGNGP